MNDQKRLTCPKCGQLMTRMVVNNPMKEGWRVSYRCLKCGKMGPLVRGGRREETEKMAEFLTESWIRRLKGEKEEQPERLRDSPRRAEKKPEVREVDRWAKPGEYIKIVDAEDAFNENYHNGDILLVTEYYEGELDGWVQAKGASVVIDPDEYVVLEGYRP